MANDFFLKVMEPNTATMDLKELQYGIMVGLMERYFKEDGTVRIADMQKNKKYRREKVALGYGPQHWSIFILINSLIIILYQP